MPVRNKLGYSILTDDEERTLVGLFSDPTSTELFVRILSKVEQGLVEAQNKSAQAYLFEDSPSARAMALQYKGQITMINELKSVIKQVTK